MEEVDLSNPQRGLGLTSHFDRPGVAPRFANDENVARI